MGMMIPYDMTASDQLARPHRTTIGTCSTLMSRLLEQALRESHRRIDVEISARPQPLHLTNTRRLGEGQPVKTVAFCQYQAFILVGRIN